MPWSVKKTGGRYAVVDKAGKTVHSHRSKANATAQVRALYANAGDEATHQASPRKPRKRRPPTSSAAVKRLKVKAKRIR